MTAFDRLPEFAGDHSGRITLKNSVFLRRFFPSAVNEVAISIECSLSVPVISGDLESGRQLRGVFGEFYKVLDRG